MALAQHQQFDSIGKIIGQYGVVLVQQPGSGLLGVDHESTADGVVGVLVQHTGRSIRDEGDGIGVIRQIFLEQEQVFGPVERDRPLPVEP